MKKVKKIFDLNWRQFRGVHGGVAANGTEFTCKQVS